jgi:hypothetical protein
VIPSAPCALAALLLVLAVVAARLIVLAWPPPGRHRAVRPEGDEPDDGHPGDDAAWVWCPSCIGHRRTDPDHPDSLICGTCREDIA